MFMNDVAQIQEVRIVSSIAVLNLQSGKTHVEHR